MTSRPADNGNGYHTVASVKEFFTQWLVDIEKFLEERDRRYQERYDASEKAREAALEAQKQLTQAAFASAQKAVDKAEQAQAAYNARSNEFRDALSDANKNNVSAAEYGIGHQAILDRLDRGDARVAEQFNEVKESIKNLEISKANISGKADQTNKDDARTFSIVSLIGTLVAIGLGVIALIRSLAPVVVK